MVEKWIYLALNMLEFVIKILLLFFASFIIAFVLTPLWTSILYKYRNIFGKQIRQSKNSPIYERMHKNKEGTPTMGGVLIWGTVLIVIFIFWILSKITSNGFLQKLNFLDRGETWLPLVFLAIAAIGGLIDDILGAFRIGANGGGIAIRWKLIGYLIIAVIGAWWFFTKLDWDVFFVPFLGMMNIGFWYIPIFIFIIVGSAFSSNLTDGLDGLLGGVMLFAFGALAVVSFSQGRLELATFCVVIIGAILAFLWFNIHPARFFMGDTGSMALGIVLGAIAMLTNTALFLPFFAFILVIETFSSIIQLTVRKIFHRKVFLSSPIHHHFEAKGWPEEKITMRFWIISAVMSGLGLVLYFLTFPIT